MSVEKLGNNSIILMRDQASLDYLQGGQDADPSTAFVRLIEGNLTALQPSLYFQVKATGLTGYWSFKTATGKYLKVNTEPGPNQDQIQWVATDPASETVVDKSPFYFTFLKVPLSDAPSLYVLATYYNGGMTLQQPGGPGTPVVMAPKQGIPGSAPELSFEVGVTSGIPSGLGTLDPMLNVLKASAAANADDIVSLCSSSCETGIQPINNGVDPWAIALMVVLGVIALLLLGYIFYQQFTRPAAVATTTVVTPAVVAPTAVIAGTRLAGAADNTKSAAKSPPLTEGYRVPTSTLLHNMASMAPVAKALRRAVPLTRTPAPLLHSGQGSFGLPA